MDLVTSAPVSGPVDLRTAITALVLAFALSQLIALCYMLTFRGLSYSRAFVQGVAMGAIVTCMLMLAIGDSIAAGVGLAGGMSIIRFRTTMRDPRDMVFIFASLGVGVVCGLQAYAVGVAGTGVFAVASVLMYLLSYGTQQRFDGLLRFTAPTSTEVSAAIEKALASHTRHYALVTLREAAQGDLMEHAYQVRIPAPDLRTGLVAALDEVGGVRDVSLHMQEPSLEL